MIHDYLAVGDTEIINTARLYTYADTVGSPVNLAECGCESLTADVVDDEPYTTPDADPAPWYDPDVPESADFIGLLPLEVDGFDNYPMRRATSTAVTGGGVFGPARAQPRTITVTAVVLAVTCCGAAYGLHWLAEALGGCSGPGCGGECLTAYNCCPGVDESPGEFNEAHRRTFRRVALVDGPTVMERRGEGCSGTGECAAVSAEVLTVEFVLTAATPWPWTDPEVILDEVPLPRDDSGECFTWCIHGGSPQPEPACITLGDEACPPGAVPVEFTDAACEVGWPDEQPPPDPCAGPCRLATCEDPADLCSDPSCRPQRPPTPATPESCFCEALATETDIYELDLSGRAGWAADAPIITIEAGSEDLRRLKVSLYERTFDHEGLTCEEVAEVERCNPHSTYHVGYLKAGATLTLDGQIERALVECAEVCESARDVWGVDGGPPSWRLLDCDTYCLVVESDASSPPASDATLTVALSGRGY